MTGRPGFPFSIYDAAIDSRLKPGHEVAFVGTKRKPLRSAPLIFSRDGIGYRTADPSYQIEALSSFIQFSADDIVFTNMVFSGVNIDRYADQKGSFQTEIVLPNIGVYGKRVTFRGCIFRNFATGVFVQQFAAGCKMIDCLMYNSGWEAPDRTHGHSLYAQNASGVPHEFINCILGPSISRYGIHFYGVGSQLVGLHVKNAIHTAQQGLIGGGDNTPVDDIVIDDSVFWRTDLNLGDLGAVPPNGFAKKITVTNNLFAIDRHYYRDCWLERVDYGNVSRTGTENNITDVRIFPCSTPGKVAHVAIANWKKLDAVAVDISALNIPVNKHLKIRNAYAPFNDVTDHITDGSNMIPFDFVNRQIEWPLGYTPLPPAADPFGRYSQFWLDKRFGAWIVEAA